MLFESILIGLVGVFCMFDSRLLGRLNFERPLIASTLVGLVLGDLQTGLTVGAALELVSLGIVNVGAAAPPDMILGSVIASAYAILTNAKPEEALTIAIPIAVLGQMLGILVRTLLAGLTHNADKQIEKGEFKSALRNHWLYGSVFYALMYFVPIFLAIYFGTNVVENFIAMIPQWLSDGLGVASKVMPAYGFALLLSIMATKKNFVFYALGFLITAYSGLGMTGVTFVAVVLAIIFTDLKFNKTTSSKSTVSNNEDDFLDEEDDDYLSQPDYS